MKNVKFDYRTFDTCSDPNYFFCVLVDGKLVKKFRTFIASLKFAKRLNLSLCDDFDVAIVRAWKYEV